MTEQQPVFAFGLIALVLLTIFPLVDSAFVPSTRTFHPSESESALRIRMTNWCMEATPNMVPKAEVACTAHICPTPELTPEIYAKWRESKLGNLTESIERGLMLELVGDDLTGKSILEIGCGDGNLVVELSKATHGLGKMTAVDASNAMIEAAKSRASEHRAEVTFSAAIAQDLPFDDMQFDLVVAQTILCFIKDPLPVFREISRVLRPGGTIVIGELGKWSTWALERRLKAMRGSSLWKKGVFRTAEELKGLALSAGLLPSRISGAVYYPRYLPLARLLSPYDHIFSRISTVGAAFLAMKASKPA
uniref:Methyltransferase type 11 domain-containing protein n=1 Tax=Odontella aurita TaxID=265563 RepID=A0A7S4K3P3_9STRA|mmetsp:Transcript_60934/g.180395  ORF Transcript_60934/g.180395 Transcript_60934/m.180395 type:complete len:306 (+) Transcript_60934:73-990(+)